MISLHGGRRPISPRDSPCFGPVCCCSIIPSSLGLLGKAISRASRRLDGVILLAPRSLYIYTYDIRFKKRARCSRREAAGFILVSRVTTTRISGAAQDLEGQSCRYGTRYRQSVPSHQAGRVVRLLLFFLSQVSLFKKKNCAGKLKKKKNELKNPRNVLRVK